MPATALVIASLVSAEPPRGLPERPVAFVQTTWSLSAAPRAIAVAGVYGPTDAPQVGLAQPAPTGVPEATPDDTFDDLVDPAAPADQAGLPPTADTATDPLATDPLATDPFADEFAQELTPAADPLEGFNRISFAVSMAIDKAVLRPLALGFQQVAPKPARDGLRNVLANLGEPVTFVNDILQLKPKRAVRTLGRFLLNTLFGLGGLFDIAKDKKFNLPRRSNSFSNTLAFYGMKAGPYIYIPILGPTTLRDQVDRVQGMLPWVDRALRDGRGTASAVLVGLDQRADADRDLEILLGDAVDPYATFRETWLQQRQGQIDQLKAPDGEEPTPSFDPLDDPLNDPLNDSGADPAGPADVTPAP